MMLNLNNDILGCQSIIIQLTLRRLVAIFKTSFFSYTIQIV